MTFAQAHTFTQVDHMLVLPVRRLARLSWNVGRFHEGPVERIAEFLGT